MILQNNCKGIWIPENVWLDFKLTPLDKIILMAVDSLDNDEKGCCATNDSLADFCKCSIREVSESIALLIGLGYLHIRSFDGRERQLKSLLK